MAAMLPKMPQALDKSDTISAPGIMHFDCAAGCGCANNAQLLSGFQAGHILTQGARNTVPLVDLGG